MNHEDISAERGPRADNNGSQRRPNPFIAFLRGIGGAAVGGTVGYFGFNWIVDQGFYALILPGALLGLGFGLASQYRSIMFGLICAVAALVLGCYAEWTNFAFKADDSFGYFMTHLNLLKPVTIVMLVAGTFFGFWFGRGR